MVARPHILLVDDSALVLDALRLLFQESGYDVSIARSVTEAVDAAVSRSVDVMLLDLTLPDGDGLEILIGCPADVPLPFAHGHPLVRASAAPFTMLLPAR